MRSSLLLLSHCLHDMYAKQVEKWVSAMQQLLVKGGLDINQQPWLHDAAAHGQKLQVRFDCSCLVLLQPTAVAGHTPPASDSSLVHGAHVSHFWRHIDCCACTTAHAQAGSGTICMHACFPHTQVQLLLKCKADPARVDKNGYNALHLALQSRTDPELVEHLLRAHAHARHSMFAVALHRRVDPQGQWFRASASSVMCSLASV